jgi:hypothetical protein
LDDTLFRKRHLRAACITRASRGNFGAGIAEQTSAPSNSEIFTDAARQLELTNGVQWALSWFIRDTQFQPEEASIREELKDTIAAISRFESALPKEHEAAGRFVYETYTGEAFQRDELKPTEHELILLQDAWRDQFGFDAIGETLKTMRSYLAAAQQCLGKARPPNHRALTFVRSLANVWEAQTGKKPVSGRDPIHNKQSGPSQISFE